MSTTPTAKRRAPRDFRKIQQLPSGRFHASYLTPDKQRRNAPHTFRTCTEALAWLADVRTELESGKWHDPKAGEITVERWIETYVTTNMRIKKESTRELIRRDARL